MTDGPNGHAPTTAEQGQSAKPADRTVEYLGRDLHAERAWPISSKARYGAVTFDARDRVLLREPTNHFDGFAWTFPKGGPDKGEHPVETALRETAEETGYAPVVIGHIPGSFQGGNTSSVNFFFLAYETEGQVDRSAMRRNGETSSVRWATREEARDLISESTNTAGRERDFRTLDAAYDAYSKIDLEPGRDLGV